MPLHVAKLPLYKFSHRNSALSQEIGYFQFNARTPCFIWFWLKTSITVDIETSLTADKLEETSLQAAVFVTQKEYTVHWYLAAELLVTFSPDFVPVNKDWISVSKDLLLSCLC